MKSFEDFFPTENRKHFLLSISLIILLGVGFVLGVVALDHLIKQQDGIGEINREVASLTEKKEKLESINLAKAQGEARIATYALPPKPRLIAAVNVIRAAAGQHQIVIDQVRSTSEGKKTKEDARDALIKTEIVVDLVGDELNIRDFIAKVESSFPIIRVNTGKLTSEEGIVKVNISFQTFSKALPITLPSAISPLPELTREEEKLIAELSEIGKTELIPAPEPSAPAPGSAPGGGGRPNPFSL